MGRIYEREHGMAHPHYYTAYAGRSKASVVRMAPDSLIPELDEKGNWTVNARMPEKQGTSGSRDEKCF